MLNSLFGRHKQTPALRQSAVAVEERAVEVPVSATARLNFPNGLSRCGQVIQTVPWGKRLCLDSLSFQGVSEGGQGFLRISVVQAGQVKNCVIPAMRCNPVLAPEAVSGTAAIGLSADPGTTVVVTYHRGGRGGGSGVTVVAVSLAGRYMEIGW